MTKGAGGYAATATAGPGRTGVVFGTQRHNKSIWVFPSDVVSLIAAGRLDKRLFEVTALAENGYGDDKRTTIPLIVQHSKGKPAVGKPIGAAITRELPSADATAVGESKRSAGAFWEWLTGSTKVLPGKKTTVGGAFASNVGKVWLDGPMKANLDQSVPQTGAPTAWRKGYTGKDVKVAVLDTGIDSNHLDLKDAVVAAKDFSGSGNTADHFGHGTHVASIITGDGARSNGKYMGVAPDAVLLNGKVLNDSGSGNESGIIAGMEWAVAQEAKVVNLSLGGRANDGTDPVSLALNQLSLSSGALFVVAAGNSGPARYTVSTPATAAEALSVAASNRNQTTASFSSAGPRLGDFAVKPEIAAPGVDIVAARAADAGLGEPVGDHYMKLSGTSMATPHVAGAAAILAQQQPTWNARLLKTALMGTAKLPVNESVYRQGAGFLDVSRAVTQKVFALESSVSASLGWPYPARVERTVTYRNPGAAPLTLDLGFDPRDQNGNPAPAGVFDLPQSVTIPARTTAKVTLTIDPAKSKPGWQYQGRITATATGVLVRTPVSLTLEKESYEVTVGITDRNGNQVSDFDHGNFYEVPYLINLGNGSAIRLESGDGKIVVRVPRGAYTITFALLTGDASTGVPSTTLMSVPRFAVTAPTVANFDARAGKRATAKVEAAEAKTSVFAVYLDQQIGDDLWRVGATFEVTDGMAEPEVYVVGTPTVSRPFVFFLRQLMLAPDRTYELLLSEAGKLPDNPAYPVADSSLADLSIVLGAHNVKAQGIYVHHMSVEGPEGRYWAESFFRVTTPSTRRHLVSTTAFGAPIRWQSQLYAEAPSGEHIYSEDGAVEPQYEPGKRYKVRMSTAAFTPQGVGDLIGAGSMSANFGPFNSSGGGLLFDSEVQGSWVLKRNGRVIAESPHPYGFLTDEATGTATYTAVMYASRQAMWSGYVPKVSGTWTFKATAPTSDRVQLPIISTAVDGDFDGWGRAPAGKAFPLTLNVKGAAGGVASATVRVSYDDGRTWTTVPVSNASGRWVATVNHPNVASAWVSLRVIVTDTQGNSGGYTATRSYKIAQLG